MALAPSATLLRRSWGARVAVAGHSMEPTLLPGDWLLVDPDAYADRSPQAGELVVATDPREPGRLIVKRVEALDVDGRLRLSGDHPAHRQAAQQLVFDAAALGGQAWLRYWPLARVGRVR